MSRPVLYISVTACVGPCLLGRIRELISLSQRVIGFCGRVPVAHGSRRQAVPLEAGVVRNVAQNKTAPAAGSGTMSWGVPMPIDVDHMPVPDRGLCREIIHPNMRSVKCHLLGTSIGVGACAGKLTPVGGVWAPRRGQAWSSACLPHSASSRPCQISNQKARYFHRPQSS